MDINKLKKGLVWGISTIIGLAVAEGIYRASVNTIGRRELIGDGEVISDETEEEVEVKEEDLPF